MKVPVLIALALSFNSLAIPAFAEKPAKKLNVLFLGNSFTARHDVAGLVEKILEEGDPATDVQVQRVIYGGQNMFKHSTYYFSQSFIEQSTLSNKQINERIATLREFLKSDAPPNPEEWQQHQAALGKSYPFAKIHSHIASAIKNHEALLGIILRQSGTTWSCRVGEMCRISRIRRMSAMRQSLLRLRKHRVPTSFCI